MPKTIVLPPLPKPVFGVYNQWGRLPNQLPYGQRSTERFTVGYRVPNMTGPTHLKSETLKEQLVQAWRRHCNSIRRSSLTMEDVMVGRTFSAREQRRTGLFTLTHSTGNVILAPTRGWLYADITVPDEPFTVERVLKTHRTLRLVGGGRIDFPKKMGLLVVESGVLDDIYGPLIENSD